MDKQLNELAARVDALSDFVRATNQHSTAPDHSSVIEDLREEIAELKAAQRKAGPDAITREVQKQMGASMRQLPALIVPGIRDRINQVEKVAENASSDARREAETVVHELAETVHKSMAAHQLKAVMGAATIRAFIREELSQ